MRRCSLESGESSSKMMGSEPPSLLLVAMLRNWSSALCVTDCSA